jgi:hypothetical protein
MFHLLLGCVFREVWFRVLQPNGWHHIVPEADSHMADWWLDARKAIVKPRSAFDSVVLLVARPIWLERNDRFFSRSSSAPAVLVQKNLVAVEDWCRAVALVRE